MDCGMKCSLETHSNEKSSHMPYRVLTENNNRIKNQYQFSTVVRCQRVAGATCIPCGLYAVSMFFSFFIFISRCLLMNPNCFLVS